MRWLCSLHLTGCTFYSSLLYNLVKPLRSQYPSVTCFRQIYRLKFIYYLLHVVPNLCCVPCGGALSYVSMVIRGHRRHETNPTRSFTPLFKSLILCFRTRNADSSATIPTLLALDLPSLNFNFNLTLDRILPCSSSSSFRFSSLDCTRPRPMA
ncbi:hypothetical protein DL93DRAFT_1519682 [Clavulina sp. PMI_390]|nr:hypothetical protein DL93DRAFT_1519682 [Clavulina sp. PMI_390]